eukprot:778318-Pyramimonas_sp.AAC.1
MSDQMSLRAHSPNSLENRMWFAVLSKETMPTTRARMSKRPSVIARPPPFSTFAMWASRARPGARMSKALRNQLFFERAKT